MMKRIGLWLGLALWLAGGSAALAFTVSGTARDTTGVAVVGAEVLVYDDEDKPVGGFPPTFTDGAGFYSISAIPAGTWGLGFTPPSATGLLGKLVSGIVVSGDLTVDVTLVRGAVLSGTVRDTLGQGIFNIDLNVYDQLTGDAVEAPGDNTDLVGFYDVVVAPGLYRLRWRDVSGGRWVAVEFENVAIGGDTTIDVTMLSGFFLSGTVRDSTGTPVVNADLDCVESLSGILQLTLGDNTDSNGNYQVLIPANSYDITATPPGAALLLTDTKAGVTISADTTIDFTLATGRVLSGFVRDPLSAPVAGVDLDVRDASTGVKLITPGDNTDATGFYDVLVPNGTYDVDYQPPVTSGLAPVRLPAVSIQVDTTIDVSLVTGVHLSGLVTHPSGTPAVGIDLDVKEASSGAVIPVVGDQTDLSGLFDMIVPTGLLDIEVEPPAVLHLASARLAGLSITADTSLSVQLDTGMALIGTVRDSLGLPVAGVEVWAVIGVDTAFTPSHTTDSAGLYTVLLAPETYDLAYHPPLASGLPDTVLSAVAVAGDTTIDVTYGGATALHIAGTVLGPLGSPAIGADIEVKNASTGADIPVSGGVTDNAGQFDIVVPELAVDLHILPPGALHLAAARLTGLAPSSDTSIMVSLDTGLVVGGTVRDSAGDPVAGVEVWAIIGSDTAFTPSNTTSAGGAYALYLGPTTYDLAYHPAASSGLPDTLLPGLAIARDTTVDIDYPTTATGDTERGDVNQDNNITSADIIYLVNFVFKGGPAPQPTLTEGDTNCDGNVTSADIIYLVNFVFKGGPPPVCP